MTKGLGLACLMLLAAAAGAETEAAKPAPAPQQTQWRIGETAPVFQLSDLKGKKFSSEALKGSPAVLFFAATWCPYSNRLSKAVEVVHNNYKGKGVKVLLIDIKEPGDKAAAKWVEEKKMTCPVFPDLDGSVTRAYGPPPDVEPKTAREDLMTATVILLDRESKIRYFPKPSENPAEIDWELKTVQAKLDGMLAKPKKKKA